jgi:hypothetical protein
MKKDIVYWLEELKKEFYPDTYFDNCDGNEFEDLICREESEKYSVTLESRHGGEGKENDYWKVFKVVDLKTSEVIYIKFVGSYDSWNGTLWEYEAILAVPVEKTIIEFKEVK